MRWIARHKGRPTGAPVTGRHGAVQCLQCVLLALLLAGCTGRAPETAAPAPLSTPPRIVSLSPNLTEILCAIGASDTLVGRSSACDFPPDEVRDIPLAGGFGAPDIESLLSLHPTLVVFTDLADKRLPERLKAFGITTRHVPCTLIDDVLEAILLLGAWSDRSTEAAALHEELSTRIEELRAERAAREARGDRLPTVFVEIWHPPPMTCGRNSFVSELVSLAGGNNLGDVMEQPFYAVDGEWVLVRDPDIVYCAYMSAEHSPLKRLRARPGWHALRAVRNGAIFQATDPDLVLRPGPRLLQGIEDLRACILRHEQL